MTLAKVILIFLEETSIYLIKYMREPSDSASSPRLYLPEVEPPRREGGTHCVYTCTLYSTTQIASYFCIVHCLSINCSISTARIGNIYPLLMHSHTLAKK